MRPDENGNRAGRVPTISDTIEVAAAAFCDVLAIMATFASGVAAVAFALQGDYGMAAASVAIGGASCGTFLARLCFAKWSKSLIESIESRIPEGDDEEET